MYTAPTHTCVYESDGEPKSALPYRWISSGKYTPHGVPGAAGGLPHRLLYINMNPYEQTNCEVKYVPMVNSEEPVVDVLTALWCTI